MAEERRRYAANRIRELRLERGLKLEDVVDRMDDAITPGTLAKLETGRMGLTVDYIIAIAKALQVPEEAIIKVQRSGLLLPIIGQIAAGQWREAIMEPLGWQGVPPDLRTGVNSFVLFPDGDSMDLVTGEGGYIVVDPDQKDLLNKRFYSMQNEAGEATFKQFFADPPRLEPCSSNPVHQIIPLGREPIIVIGRVTLAVREF
jgi:repressor LexA